MPYPNEHSARLRNPGDFDPDTFRRTKGGIIYGRIKAPQTIGIIWGKLKGSSAPEDMPIPQTLRFSKNSWSVSKVRAWLKDNNIKFVKLTPATTSGSGFGEQLLKAFGLFGDDQLPELFSRFQTDRIVFEPTGSYTYLEEEKVGDLEGEAIPLYQELKKEGRYTQPNIGFCSVCGMIVEYDEGIDMSCSICDNTLSYGFGYLDRVPLYGFLDRDIPRNARKPIDFVDDDSPFYVIKQLDEKGEIETIHVLPLFYQEEDKRGADTEDFDLETVNVSDVEIFAVGTWKGDPYVEKDLDELVVNFDLLKEEVKPPLKIGHQSEKEQRKFLRGMPAIGKVVSLKRVGTKLLADINSVPKKIADLINAKAYDRVSSEIYMRYQQGKKKFGKVLAAIALLGAEIPAVKTLRDVVALYDQNGEDTESKIYDYIIGADSDEEILGGIDTMTDAEARLKQLEEQIAALTKAIDDSKVTLEEKDTDLEEKTKTLEEKEQALKEKDETLVEKEKELETTKTALEEAQKQEAEIAEAQRISGVKLYIEDAVKAGKVLPVFKDDLMDLMCHVESIEKVELMETAEDGTITKRETTLLDLCKGIVGKFPKMIDFEEISSSGGSEEEADVTKLEEQYRVDKTKTQDLVDVELSQKAKKYAEEHKVDYSIALSAVSKEME